MRTPQQHRKNKHHDTPYMNNNGRETREGQIGKHEEH